MILEPIEPYRLAYEWNWISERCSLPRLLARLASREAVAFRLKGTDAALVLSTAWTADTGKPALWIECVGGTVSNRPKDNLRIMRAVLAECEALATRFKCKELRIEGGSRAGWKLRLLPALGFERIELPSGFVMRKAL